MANAAKGAGTSANPRVGKVIRWTLRWWLLLGLIVSAIEAEGADRGGIPWDLDSLSRAPQVDSAPDATAEGLKGLYFRGLNWKGRQTRVFAWYGAPPMEAGRKVPAVVLLHGGGGTAFPEWVRVWNRHGYAAIAPALEGQAPGPPEKAPYRLHDASGPQRAGTFGDIDQPVEDQWFYHAVADAILAHSLLRSFPELDAERTGVTGISWGGILTSAVAGVDPRFKFAIPVYGCGFLAETPIYSRGLDAQGATQKYLKLWEPANFLPNATLPMLWVNGANDKHFPLNAHAKSSRLPHGLSSVSVRVGMAHGHSPGWAPAEIYAFADQVVKGADHLPRITDQGRVDHMAWAGFVAKHPIRSAELIFTTDPKDWVTCEWERTPAKVEAVKAGVGIVRAKLPPNCRGYFFNLTDDRDLLVSTPMEVVP